MYENMKNEDKETALTNNPNSNQASSRLILKSSILKPSQLGAGTNSATTKQSKIFQPFSLKPSALNTTQLSGNSNSLSTNDTDDKKSETATANSVAQDAAAAVNDDSKFPKLNAVNPFNRILSEEEPVEDGGKKNVPEKNADKIVNSVEVGNEESAKESKINNEDTDPITILTRNGGIPKSSLFSSVTSTITEASSFVFGQNVHERVTGNENNEPASNSTSISNAPTTTTPTAAATTATSNSDLLFSSGLPEHDDATNSDNLSSDSALTDCNKNRSLIDAAREYEESRAQKRKYDEVETITGEEDELNIIEINCKLFAFIASNWEERGRGTLRLNDFKNSDSVSRVVFRTSGALRVLINTKIWAGMIAEQPSQKSLRLTAIDKNGQIKVFLVMARPVDIKLLYDALADRIQLEKLKVHNQDDISNSKEDEHKVKKIASSSEESSNDF